MVKRISIYIDGANFFHGLKIVNKNYSDLCFDFERFVRKIVGKDELVNIYYYNAPLKEKFNKWVYWEQVKFFDRLRKIPKLKLILCKRQKRLDGDDNEYYVIKGDDIHLALDMLRDACKDNYDKVVLISGDGDFAPLVKYVKIEGKEVVNYSFDGSGSRDLLKEFSKENRFVINKKTVNKFFWRRK
ncbi:MAG TPA: NYN domain-containing protein [Candidatus Pacearchaeota archaeon]|nr:NYN domain-containing protein [Candidatus Pacearchaeota archaeon]